MTIKKLFVTTLSLGLLLGPQSGFAAVSDEMAAKLGKELTPLGGERKGNAEGTIPDWDGGITKPVDGYKKGDHHPDPFADDKPLFTITGENVDQYKEKLSAGHVAMLKKYSTFKMNVYPTHRSAAAPQRIYDATLANATRAHLSADGYNLENAAQGIPFPIPQNGQEAIWNHLTRYRGYYVERNVNEASVTPRGSYTLANSLENFYVIYSAPGATYERLHNILLYLRQSFLSPARIAGTLILVHETLNEVREPRHSWIYTTGQRRVRRAPFIAYDDLAPAADSQRTFDQFDVFNGALDRYDWKLVGKQELYVPYNAYKLHSDKVKYADILKRHHINPDLARYELHRVWKVEATVRKGMRHIYARRTFYLDEDSWQILLVDQYDAHGNLWRVSEGHPINYYEVPLLWTTLETIYDLESTGYVASQLANEGKTYQFDVPMTEADFTPSELRRDGLR